jgi:hypothetical protein
MESINIKVWEPHYYPGVITKVAEYGTYVPWKELEVITRRKVKFGTVMV